MINQKDQNTNGRKIIIPDNNIWKRALKNLVDSGELSVEDYNKCVNKLKRT